MKKFKILSLVILFSLSIMQVSASTVDKIEAIKDNEILLTSSNDVSFSNVNVEGEVKLLKDISISFTSIDSDNSKKVLLNLSDDLKINTSYSLITIIGDDGNIDFRIGNKLEGEILNTSLLSGEEGIEKINIINSKTLELFYKSDLKSDEFEYKLLSDIPLSGMSSDGTNKLKLQVTNKLDVSTSYIIMILALENALGSTITFNEDLHELLTPGEFSMDKPVENVVEEVPVENTEEVVEVDPIENEELEVEEFVEPIDEGNMENIAMNREETPETGTSTGVFILLFIIANLVYFFRKK